LIQENKNLKNITEQIPVGVPSGPNCPPVKISGPLIWVVKRLLVFSFPDFLQYGNGECNGKGYY